MTIVSCWFGMRVAPTTMHPDLRTTVTRPFAFVMIETVNTAKELMIEATPRATHKRHTIAP